MKKYVKEICLRGFIFAGLGPVVLGVVMMILGFSHVDLRMEGWQIFLGIVSTYVLAFVQAGSSVFEQIEEWSPFRSAFTHLLSIYLVYLFAYLINRWIPFDWLVVLIFSACVIVTFVLIWLICFLVSRNSQRKLNSILQS